jgi:hypothetical protein
VRPAPLVVSPMIQRAVSPAAMGPGPVSRSPGSGAMPVIWPGAAWIWKREHRDGGLAIGEGRGRDDRGQQS